MSPRLIAWVVGVALVAASFANTIFLAGLAGLAAGIVAHRVAAAARGRDGAERLLGLATAGLPPLRAEWGAAMRAELAAIEDPEARRRFARSAAAAAFGHGLGLRIAIALGTGGIVAAAVLATSRAQLEDAGPGILEATVPIPAFLLLAVALVTAYTARSFRMGIETGVLALAASFAAVVAVTALEGLVWMDRHGIFVLDADPPRHAAGDLDVVLDIFTTGMWLGHLLFWLPWAVAGAALGAWGARRQHGSAVEPPANGAARNVR